MTRRQKRECTRIDHTQSLDAVNSCFTVDNCHGILPRPHFTCTGCMPHRDDRAANGVKDLLVGCHICSRIVFRPSRDRLQGVTRPNFSGSFEDGQRNLDVGLACEPIRIDYRQILGGVGDEGDVSARCWRNESADYGGVLPSICGLTFCGIAVVSNMRIECDILPLSSAIDSSKFPPRKKIILQPVASQQGNCLILPVFRRKTRHDRKAGGSPRRGNWGHKSLGHREKSDISESVQSYRLCP